MKLIDNAVEIAAGLTYAPNFHTSYQMPNWEKLMEYEDSDWDALQTLRKKYLKEMPNWGLNQKTYEDRKDDGFLSYEYIPSNFKYQVIKELSYRKQDTKKKHIRIECDNAFASITNAALIYKHILLPIMKLNVEEEELACQIDRVNKLRENTGSILANIKDNNGNLQYVVNELIAS